MQFPRGFSTLVLSFLCVFVRKSLSSLMKSREADLEVKLLLFAIQKTTTFEKFLANRFVSSEYMESVRSKINCMVNVPRVNLFFLHTVTATLTSR